MTPQSPASKKEEYSELKQLFACTDQKADAVFFASMVDRSDQAATMRSSTHVDKGMTLSMYPVPATWDGGAIPAETIAESSETLTAQVSRIEGRGEFQVRLLTAHAESVIRQFRGQASQEAQAVVSYAGEVATVAVRGKLSVSGAAVIESSLRAAIREKQKIILDLSGLDLIASNSIGVLVTFLREIEKKHVVALRLLVPPDSAMQELLEQMNLKTALQVHADRDQAVASFYM